MKHARHCVLRLWWCPSLVLALLRGCAAPSATVSQAPEGSSEFLRSATAQFEQGDWSGAIAEATKALEINPRLAEAYVNRSLAGRQQGDLSGSIADATKALELNPRLPAAYVARAFARAMQSDRIGAREDLNKALGIKA